MWLPFTLNIRVWAELKERNWLSFCTSSTNPTCPTHRAANTGKITTEWCVEVPRGWPSSSLDLLVDSDRWLIMYIFVIFLLSYFYFYNFCILVYSGQTCQHSLGLFFPAVRNACGTNTTPKESYCARSTKPAATLHIYRYIRTYNAEAIR